jgi:ankyrin repeat protein
MQAAARGGNLELCKPITGRGWYSNLSGSGIDSSALQVGVVSRNSEVLEFILSYGADVNVEGGCYGTYIRAAVEIEDLEICRLLISKGADVNLTIVASETALLSAATKENLDICQLLLTSGTIIIDGIMKVAWSTENEKKWDMLHLLGRHGGNRGRNTSSIFRYLAAILGFTIRSRKVQNVTQRLQFQHQRQRRSLWHCYSNGRQLAKPGACAALPDHGANPNIIGGEFGAALHAAVVCGRDDLFTMLIDAGADVNAVSNGDTALHLAARHRHNKLAEILLEKGANPAAVGASRRTALLLTAASGQESWVKLLLNKYGSINKNTSNGNIALSLAAVDAAVDADGRVTLHLAAMNGHDGVVRLLLKTGASSDTTLHKVGATKHERLLMLLAEADGGINRKDSSGDVPLGLAAANQHKAVVNLLLANGADIVSCGDAALRIDIRTKDISLVEVLIKKGADVNATGPNGQTILQLALLKETGDIVRLLRDHGAQTT